MRIGYYPGCSLYSTFREGDESLRTIAPLLGVELAELDDWVLVLGTNQNGISGYAFVAAVAGVLLVVELVQLAIWNLKTQPLEWQAWNQKFVCLRCENVFVPEPDGIRPIPLV